MGPMTAPAIQALDSLLEEEEDEPVEKVEEVVEGLVVRVGALMAEEATCGIEKALDDTMTSVAEAGMLR